MSRKKNRNKQDVIKVKEPDYYIYTDGGCAFNPGGPGSIGVLIIDRENKETQEICKGYTSTTNNRMEILAVIESLLAVPEGSSAQIYSDSKYVINCMSGAWQKKKNEDLWERLKDVRRGKRIGLTWVRGHNGNSYNERCDALATRGMGLGNKDVDEGYLRQKEESRDF